MIVNPARAGMIPRTGLLGGVVVSKPRASGDDPPAEEGGRRGQG